MIIEKLKRVRQKIVTDVKCDMCGSSCKNGRKNFEYMTMKAHWGYYSEKDLELWEAHICEGCVNKLKDTIKFKRFTYELITGNKIKEIK